LFLVELHDEDELLIEEVGDEGEKFEHIDQEEVVDVHVSFIELDGFDAKHIVAK